MSHFKDKLSNFFFLDEIEGTAADEKPAEIEPVKPVDIQETKNKNSTPKFESRIRKKVGGENVVAINQKQSLQKPQITIVEPRLYSEVHEIADYILANQSVIINFRRMDNDQAKKLIDFLMGVTYAVKGDIQRLGEEIFICTPQNVTVTGSELSEFTDSFM